MHEGERGAKAKKSRRKRDQGLAQAAAASSAEAGATVTAGPIGRGPYPIGQRPQAVDPITAAGPRPPNTPPPQSVLDAAAASAEEDDQPRVAEGSLGARSKKKAAPTFRKTKRGSRGGRNKRRMLPSATSEVSSNEVIDDVLGSA